jgi:peroxiredoxin
MQKIRETLSVLFIFASAWAMAQPVLIKGLAPSYEGKEISAYSYKDLITYTPVKIGSSQVNDSGRFSISIDGIKTSQYLYLSINNEQGSIYVSPSSTYHVIFPPPDSTHYENPFTVHMVDMTFIEHDSDNINSMVIDFNEQFDKFWNQCYLYFIRKEGPHYLDSFYLAMQHRYASVNNAYFKNYMQYNIAEIGINILEGPKILGEKYIQNKPVLYHSYEYMKFFNDYFNDYVEQFSLTSKGEDINRYLQSANYNGMKEVLKINTLLRTNDSLCELVLLKGLYEMYYSGTFNKESVKQMIGLVSTNTKIEESKIIAGDMLNSFSAVISGNATPDFALKDVKGAMSSIIDFRGKYLYLCFFRSKSDQCLSELDVISSLYKRYGKKLNIVCISEDDKLGDLQIFLDQHKIFTWTFLYDEGGKVRDKYDVKTLPEFFLINPQGKFYLSPADSPSHGIELIFDKLFAEPKKKKNQ